MEFLIWQSLRVCLSRGFCRVPTGVPSRPLGIPVFGAGSRLCGDCGGCPCGSSATAAKLYHFVRMAKKRPIKVSSAQGRRGWGKCAIGLFTRVEMPRGNTEIPQRSDRARKWKTRACVRPLGVEEERKGVPMSPLPSFFFPICLRLAVQRLATTSMGSFRVSVCGFALLRHAVAALAEEPAYFLLKRKPVFMPS